MLVGVFFLNTVYIVSVSQC